MHKSEAALLLEPHVDRPVDANVTDSSEFGRIFVPPAEGRFESSLRKLAVGLKVRVKLVSTDLGRGFIDFVAID
jgi:exoribonuclease-2